MRFLTTAILDVRPFNFVVTCHFNCENTDGYQITGIANRTTLADGNTWNHEHIALLGRTLTAPEKDAHRIARHLADYVLVWAGGGGDDVAKSPHLRRIANSVYRGLCSEPTCREFGFYVSIVVSGDNHTQHIKMVLIFRFCFLPM